MAKHNEGDLIPLYFDGFPGFEIIKGHVDTPTAGSAVANAFGDAKSAVSKVEHTYGFWGVNQDEHGEPCQWFYLRDKPGRGRFKVTLAYCDHL